MSLLADTIKLVAAPSLIIMVVILVAVAVYQKATSQRDKEESEAALHQIQRCPECQQIVAPSASACRHCGASFADPAAEAEERQLR